jgi:streptogramin lyase
VHGAYDGLANRQKLILLRVVAFLSATRALALVLGHLIATMKRAVVAPVVLTLVLMGCSRGAACPVQVTISEHALPSISEPVGIVAGPDGNLWFAEETGNNIGRITPAGVITEFPVPTSASQPQGITAGSDGNLWFTESVGNNIGRITPAGVITEFAVPAAGEPIGITAGADGNLWFTEVSANKIGKISIC